MTSFEYKGHTYLAVANHYNQKYNINSALFKWMQKQGQKTKSVMTKSLSCFMHWYSDSICSKIEENGSDLGIVKIDIFDK